MTGDSATISAAGGAASSRAVRVSSRVSRVTTVRVDTPAGPQAVHDHRLILAALVSVYDEPAPEVRLRTGPGRAAVIRGRDLLAGMAFSM